MRQSDVFISMSVEISTLLVGEEAAHIAGMEPKQAGKEQEKRIETALKNVLPGARVKVERVYLSVSQYKEYKNAE